MEEKKYSKDVEVEELSVDEKAWETFKKRVILESAIYCIGGISEEEYDKRKEDAIETYILEYCGEPLNDLALRDKAEKFLVEYTEIAWVVRIIPTSASPS